MNITTKAVLSNLRRGESPCYRLVPTNVTHITEKEFLERLSAAASQDPAQARYWLDTFRDQLFRLMAQNCAVDTGFLFAKLNVRGSVASATEQPTRQANPVEGVVYFKGDIAAAIRAIDVVNETLTVDAILYEVMQDGASDTNRIESADVRVVVNGARIKEDPNQSDNGVWLEDIVTGEIVSQGTVTYSDSSTCYVTFATLPPTGRYRLAIATRDGEDPETYSLAKVTRIVQVVNGENA